MSAGAVPAGTRPNVLQRNKVTRSSTLAAPKNGLGPQAPASRGSSRRLDFIPQAGRSSRSLEGSVNPLFDRYALDAPSNLKGDPEHHTLGPLALQRADKPIKQK